ncbi:MAG: MBL fold metallo-hydrolase [Methanobacteriaceae archaeon]|nr:MBL fold metallo-hydrolase [Methanobacteriaceae archaeon]
MNKKGSLKITVLYDNNCHPGFKAGWGFSSLVEFNDSTLLFDTGWDGNVLLHNLQAAEVKVEEIDMVVLSHDHWDHMGGITHILPLMKNPKVILLKSFSKNLKSEIRNRSEILEIEQSQSITDGVWTTGELGKKIKEQSMVVEIGEGMGKVIITGCAHPDLKSIIKNARNIGEGEVKALIGGLHDSRELDMLDGIDLVVPCHCTQRKDEIRSRFSNSYAECAAGDVFNF